MSIGVDEVGRGCWAGPLLVVAARFKTRQLPLGLKDSKLLSKLQRDKVFPVLLDSCEFGEGWVQPIEIDRLGLGQALYLAGERALTSLAADKDSQVILDGAYNYLPKIFTNVKYFPRADNLEPIVSAASIYAKVKRDAYMIELAKTNTNYKFDKHVGYGTKAHHEALKVYGPIKGVHRFSFKPVAELAV